MFCYFLPYSGQKCFFLPLSLNTLHDCPWQLALSLCFLSGSQSGPWPAESACPAWEVARNACFQAWPWSDEWNLCRRSQVICFWTSSPEDAHLSWRTTYFESAFYSVGSNVLTCILSDRWSHCPRPLLSWRNGGLGLPWGGGSRTRLISEWL